MLKMAEEKAFYLHVVPLSTIGEAEGGGVGGAFLILMIMIYIGNKVGQNEPKGIG